MSAQVDPASYRLAVEIPVRFRDTDGMGHVNNSVYLTYLEVARERYWRELFALSDYRQVEFILARVEIDFRAPATVGQTVVVGLRASAIGRRSFDFSYAGWDSADRRLVLSARSVQVMYDYAARASKDLPEEIRKKLIAFEAPGSIAVR